jgi:hypothetical protein
MADPFIEARERAKRAINGKWQAVARTRTLGWGGPIEGVLSRYPFARSSVETLQGPVSDHLPVLIFQSRETPPSEMELAVPYRERSGNPFGTRIASTSPLPRDQVQLLSEFAQAIWFLLEQGVLPAPQEGLAMEERLRSWTGPALFGH